SLRVALRSQPARAAGVALAGVTSAAGLSPWRAPPDRARSACTQSRRRIAPVQHAPATRVAGSRWRSTSPQRAARSPRLGPALATRWPGPARAEVGLVQEEPHFHARQLNDIVVAQPLGLAADRRAVDEREVVALAAVHVDDEVAFRPAGDRGDLHAGPPQGRECFVELQLAAREGSREDLQLRFLHRRAVEGRGIQRPALAGRRQGGGSFFRRFARRTDLLDRARGGLDHHGLLELVLLLVILDKAQLMMPDSDDIPVLQRMLLDELAVDVGAVGAVQVLEEGVVQDVDDERVMTAH